MSKSRGEEIAKSSAIYNVNAVARYYPIHSTTNASSQFICTFNFVSLLASSMKLPNVQFETPSVYSIHAGLVC